MSETPPETPETPETQAVPAAPKLAEAKKTQPTTEYLVLSKEAGFWKEETTFDARSAKAAVRDFLGNQTDVEGTYVAIPVRSWQPVTVRTETLTKLTLT